MTLKKLQIEQAEWSEKNFPNNEPWQPLLGVFEELGELCHAWLKLSQGIRGDEKQHRAAAWDAVGDTVIYLADFCTRAGIDFEAAVWEAWKEVKARDWAQFPGNGRTE